MIKDLFIRDIGHENWRTMNFLICEINLAQFGSKNQILNLNV